MDAYSCRSGKSSQRKTGSGLEASSARARNDNLLIFHNSRCNINLSDLLIFTTVPSRAFMDVSVRLFSILLSNGCSLYLGRRQRSRGKARILVALSRTVFFRRSAPYRWFSAPWTTWRTFKTLLLCFARSGPTPSSRTDHSHTIPSACALRGWGEGGTSRKLTPLHNMHINYWNKHYAWRKYRLQNKKKI